VASDPDNKLVRVRGGARGFRMVRLGDWKQEQKEKKGKVLELRSRRQVKAQAERASKNAKKSRAKKRNNKRKVRS